MFMSILFFPLLPVPVIGTAVRYRASYYPRPKEQEIHLPETPVLPQVAFSTTTGAQDSVVSKGPLPDLEAGDDIKLEDDASTRDVPGRPTFFGVFMNVWRHEHFEGLLQGYFPHIIAMTTMRFYISPTFLPFVVGYSTMPFNILYIYFLIAAYRLIVSPHKFRLAEPKAMFRLTFTEYERAHPFRLLQYCGIVLPFFLHLAFTKFFFAPWFEWNERAMDSPFITPPGEEGQWYKYLDRPNWYSWMRVGMYVVFLVGATLFWTPVHVIITRLAVQPVHGPPNVEVVEERDVDKLVDIGVIAAPSYLHLTTEQRPYLGFKDCYQRIMKEEGWGVLYRCWWLTLLGFWVSALG